MTYSYRSLHDGELYDLPDFVTMSMGFEWSDLAGGTITYPENGVNAEHVVEDATIIAYWNGVEIPNGRWHLLGSQGSSVEDGVNVKSIAGKNLFKVFEKTVVHVPDGKDAVEFVDTTVGGMLINLFTAAQARGAMTGVTWDFTNAVDSDGVAWDAHFDTSAKISDEYIKIVQSLVDSSLVELRFNGTVIQAYNSGGMGSDLSATVELVAGRDYEETPYKRTIEDRAQYALIVGDEGTRQTYDNGFTVGPYGREEMGISQGGTKDPDLLLIVAQNAVAKVASVREEFTRKINLAAANDIPGVDYNVGDWISERVAETSVPYRLRAMTIGVDQQGVASVSVVLNDRILENEVKQARKLAAAIAGGSGEGSAGGTPTPTPTDDTTIPNPPSIPVISSDAYINTDGSTRSYASVDWNPPTQNTDGSAITDIKDYEVQYKLSTETLWKTTVVTTDYAVLTALAPEATLQVRVRTRDTANPAHVSVWSETGSAVLESDTIPPPKPSTPTIVNYLGAMILSWDGKGSAGEAMPDDWAGTRIHVSTVNNFDPTAATVHQTFMVSNRAATAVLSGLDYGVTHYVKLVAFDRSGNDSLPSGQVAGTPRRVVEDDIEPGAISTGVVNFDARDLGAQQTFYGPTAPAAPTVIQLDDFWVDAANNNQLKRWDGDSWEPVDDTRIATALSDSEAAAQDAQTALDAANAKVAVYFQAAAPTGLGALDTNDLWIDSDDHQKVYRWSGTAWVLTTLASTDYIASRGTDLVTNGTGYLGNNTNFSTFTFAGDSPAGIAGSFDGRTDVINRTDTMDELIPVDPSKKYKISAFVRNKKTAPSKWYFRVWFYDATQTGPMGRVQNSIRGASEATLALPLNPGDTTMKIAGGIASWQDAITANDPYYYRYINFYDYVDPNGKTFAPYTFTRNNYMPTYSASQMNFTAVAADGTVTLGQPYNGPARAAGLPVAIGRGGDTSTWSIVSAADVPLDWTQFTGILAGVQTDHTGPTPGQIPFGTQFIKIAFLHNYMVGTDLANHQFSVAGVSVSDAAAAQVTADSKTTVFSQDAAPTTVGRVNGDMWYETDQGNRLYVWGPSGWQLSQLGTQAVNFTARDIGAITTFWQAAAPGGAKVGDIWFDTDDGNKSYRWDGDSWEPSDDARIAQAILAASGAQATADGKVKTFAQTSAPVADGTGDLWVDTDDDNKLYRWDGDSWNAVDDARIAAQAAQIASLSSDLVDAQTSITTARAIADGLVTTFYQAAPPATADEGDIWVDTDDSNKSYRRSQAGAWELITDTRVSTALSNAATAQAAADGKITSYYQAAAPAGMTDSNGGDLWFDTDDGNKAYWYRPSTLGVAGWVAVPFGGNAIAPNSLSLANMVSEIRASLGQVFYDDMSDLSRWSTNAAGSGTFTVASPSDAEFGKYVGETSAYNSRTHTTKIPFDPDQLYKITWRVRRTGGAATSYFGIRTYQADGATAAGANGGNCYVVASAITTSGVFTTYTGYVKGSNVVPTATSPKPDVKTPGTVDPATRFFSPLMLSNYSSVATTDLEQISMVKIEAVPTGLVERANIALLAVNSAILEDAAVINAKIANLAVTDAKINDLAANKITTSELAAGVRIIAGPEIGTHAELTATGFYAYVDDPLDGVPNEVVRIGTDGDTLSIQDPATGGTLASISQDGVVAAQEGAFTNDIEVQGEELVGPTFLDLSAGMRSPNRDSVLSALPGGLVQWGAQYTPSGQTDNTNGVGIFELVVPVYRGRMYKFCTNPLRVRATVADVGVEIRGYRTLGVTGDPDNIPAAPTVSSAMMFRIPISNIHQTAGEGLVLQKLQAITADPSDPNQLPGTFAYNERILLAIARVTGTGNVWVDGSTLDPIEFWCEDIGPYSDNAGQASAGGGGVTGSPTPPPSTTPPKTYTKTFYSTSAATYQGSGSKRTDTTDVVQGYNSYNGDGEGIWIFPSMTATLSGATVNKVEVYAYANHWYYNSGGTALIKVHGYSAAPSTNPTQTTAVSSASWPKPGGRWVTLPSSLYAGFKSGTYKGFGMGPAGGTNLLYYGRFNGGTGARIRVTYTK